MAKEKSKSKQIKRLERQATKHRSNQRMVDNFQSRITTLQKSK